MTKQFLIDASNFSGEGEEKVWYAAVISDSFK